MGLNLDAAETLFFKRQLEYIYPNTFDVLRPALKARTVLPVNSEVPSWAKTHTYYVLDRVGTAKTIANYATDLPTIELLGKEVTATVFDYGASYVYNIKEIKYAQKNNVNIDAKKAEYTALAIAEKENKFAFFGDASLGMVGLLNHPNIPTSSVPNGASASPLWTNKTPDEILKDMNDIVTAIIADTKQVETPDTLLIPVSRWRYIKSTKVSALDSTSILQSFLANNPEISEVMPLIELEDMPANPGLKAMIAYKKDPRKLEMVVPQEFTQEPPQLENLAFKVPCYASYGGLNVYFPLSLRIAIGI